MPPIVRNRRNHIPISPQPQVVAPVNVDHHPVVRHAPRRDVRELAVDDLPDVPRTPSWIPMYGKYIVEEIPAAPEVVS